MNVLQVKKGETVARRQDKVMEWYLIQEGSVVRQFAFAEIVMNRNSIIGILENEWFACDYVAAEDSTLIIIPCKNAQDLHTILAEHETFRPIFLRTALEQRQQALCLYSGLEKRASFLHREAEELYSHYKNLCSEMLLDEQTFTRMERFEALRMQHKAENWEINSSNSLVKNYLREYMQLMIRDDSLCVGVIMEAAAQMRRVTQGIGEMVNYLLYNRDILYADSKDDMFHLYFDLAVQLSRKKKDNAPAKQQMLRILEAMKRLALYDVQQIKDAFMLCHEYNFDEVSLGRLNVAREDCVAHILAYAGYDSDAIVNFKKVIHTYRSLPDMMATDDEARKLRKEMARVFYDVYFKAFIRSMEELKKPSPILMMFFNFGFMDVQMAGEENTNALYNLTDSLGLFDSPHIFTIYRWLESIYHGEKAPSRNEFDQDYNAYLQEMKRMGNITEEQREVLKNDRKAKVEFEIRNMFQSGNRVTYGRVSTFCPIIMEEDLINEVEKMAVTVARLENAINQVRRLDYSAFYHDVLFADPERGINQEWIKKEILPDVILMPNAGSRGFMWQEASGVKSDTPARFLFPMFTISDLEEQMVETVGRYRWEICRKVQGVYWNDIREKSLTAEYCDYIQFYRKNSSLSQDAKEKLKIALTRARNNYREVFVKDYQAWMKYESQGSFRLNRVSRDILVRYCPFVKEVRQNLSTNPQYQGMFQRLETENRKRAQRLTALYDKYEAAGGTITSDLKENLKFCQM